MVKNLLSFLLVLSWCTVLPMDNEKKKRIPHPLFADYYAIVFSKQCEAVKMEKTLSQLKKLQRNPGIIVSIFTSLGFDWGQTANQKEQIRLQQKLIQKAKRLLDFNPQYKFENSDDYFGYQSCVRNDNSNLTRLLRLSKNVNGVNQFRNIIKKKRKLLNGNNTWEQTIESLKKMDAEEKLGKITLNSN